MFIRRTLSKAGKGRKKYYTYRLVESYRVGDKVRQRTLLNLGSDFSLPKPQWADLSRRIEEIVQNQKGLIEVDEKIETLAQNYAAKILSTRSKEVTEAPATYTSVAIDAIETTQSRHVGAETLLCETIRALGIANHLHSVGCSMKQIRRIEALLMAKALHGGSERGMLAYLQHRSAALEMLGLDVEDLSLSSFYRIGDLLHRHKDSLLSLLHEAQKRLLGLQDRITLFDLTNTYFESNATGIEKAKRGRSKEKRSDAPLITLALIVNEEGALKGADLYAGNVSEPSTFQAMIQRLYDTKDQTLLSSPPIVVMDAGIATEANIEWLKEKAYHYIVVSRRRETHFKADQSVVVNEKSDASQTVRAYRHVTPEGEIELYCHSQAKEAKEAAMFAKSEASFLQALQRLDEGLQMPRRMKRYDKVMEKIGRLKERYAHAACHYHVEVEKETKGINATKIHFHKKEPKERNDTPYGVYCLRSNIEEMDEKQLWHTYITLTEIESVFKSLKSELGLRPIYHRKEARVDAHLFLTLIAYTLVHTIRHQLKQKGIHDSWDTIRKNLSTLMRSTLILPTKEGPIHLRLNDRPSLLQKRYFDALGITYTPNRRKTVIGEQM